MTKWSPCRAKDGGNIDIYYQSTMYMRVDRVRQCLRTPTLSTHGPHTQRTQAPKKPANLQLVLEYVPLPEWRQTVRLANVLSRREGPCLASFRHRQTIFIRAVGVPTLKYRKHSFKALPTKSRRSSIMLTHLVVIVGETPFLKIEGYRCSGATHGTHCCHGHTSHILK